MIIRFRKKSTAEWLALFVLVMPFMFFLLINLLGLPSLVKYMVDIGWLCLLFLMLMYKGGFPNVQAKTLAKTAGFFFLMTLVGFLLNYQSIFYYLWGLRNNARFFVFFFACILFIRERSVEYYLRFFDVLFWINLPIVIYQYLTMDLAGDFLGGIFGTEKGCNAYMNIFLMVVIAKSMLCYMSRSEKLTVCLLKCAAALLIAILSELKMFILELILIVALASLFTEFSVRKLWIIIAVAAGALFAGRAIAVLFPDFSEWFSLENIFESASAETGYTGQNDLNRLTGAAIALNRFLTSLLDKIFGLGLGNCDYAAFDFLTSPFYLSYGSLNYVWFSSTFLILETGLLGFGLYILFFVVVFFTANKREKTEQGNVLYCRLAKIMALMCLALILYNSSLRSECAFMMYFILALPFIRREQPQGSPQKTFR